MNTVINYYIEANLGLLFFMILYRITLRNETQFSAQRIFWLLAIGFSLLCPLFHLNTNSTEQTVPSVNGMIPATWLPEVNVIANGLTTNGTVTPSYPLWYGGMIVYSVVAATLFIALLYRIFSLARLYTRSAKYQHNDCIVTESTGDQPTFSFFHFIFIGQAATLSPDEKKRILLHEHVHAQQYHSADILLINLIGCFFWFNPAVWIYRRELIQLHEFEADAASNSGMDPDQYVGLLARLALQSSHFQLANHLTHSLTLKRINMMKASKKKIRTWKMAAFLTALLLFFFATACQDQLRQSSQPARAESAVAKEDEIFLVVEEMATPSDSWEAFQKYLIQNLKYPASARKAGIEGKVLVSFVVNKDGTLSDFVVKQDIGGGCDEEAVRVLSEGPAWKPGKQNGMPVRQQLVLPINYSLALASTSVGHYEAKNETMSYTIKRESKNGKTYIEGKILDANQEPLPGAHIVLKGTTQGATSAMDGSFHVETAQTTGTLVISFIGFNSLEHEF